MIDNEPTAELDPRFSSPDAKAAPWAQARRQLEAAEIFWLSTVRPDGRPHVTPLIAVWTDGALYFCTGPTERKARNLESNTHCVLTTGCNRIDEGVDLVVEGEAVGVSDEATLQRVADALASKYGEPFVFTVRDGAFWSDDGGEALLFEVRPMTAFGFGKGDVFSQTRWRFQGPAAKS
jgi:general stress protein 26